MVRLLLLAALCVLFVSMGVSAQDSELGEFSSLGSTCNFGYNPWERWNAFASGNIGDSSAPVSYFFTGRTASGGASYFRPIVAMAVGPSIRSSGTGDNGTVWSATAGGDFFLSGGGTGFGGVEASGSVTLKATTIHGDVNSVSGPASITDSTAVLGDVRAPTINVAGSTVYGTKYEEVPTLSVQLSQVSAYLEKESARYAGMTDSVASSEYHNDGTTSSRVVLHSGLNVLSWTMEQIDAISPQLNIEGDTTGILVINVAGDAHTIRLPKICFDDACTTQPDAGRVLFNFHEATQFEITLSSTVYASVLAPKAAVSILRGGIWGNIFAKQLVAQSEQGQVVNIINLPWSDDNDCDGTTTPPVEPTPGSPPQCGASCAWVELLNFDPWQMWNLFSLGDIGTQERPFGSVIQGRTAALGNAWFSAITLHTGAGSSGSSSSSSEVNEWSVTVGGNFTLLGGSVRHGGVEAGKNILVQAADVSGGLTAVTGTVTIGTENNAATIKGKARAALNVFFSAGSSADGGVAVGADGLALSADIEGVAEYFKKQSLTYSTVHSAPNSVSFSPSDSTPNDIIVDLHAGVNYITLTPSAFLTASRLQLNGDADGVLVINVPGKTVQMDGLDVYENGWTNPPTKGRVLVNFFEASSLTVNWGSGSFSILAPLADVLYKSGTFAGNWIVGSVKSQWAGGTQISELAWVAPCEPDC